MPRLWRLYRAEYGPGLDGIGGTFADGRWHTRGARVVYFGASAAIVVLERLAHTDPDLLPLDLRLAYFELPQTISGINAQDISALPENWIQDENATRSLTA
jgi:RES domain-containing protein